MSQHSLRSEWALDPAELAAIRAVDEVMTELGVTYMMVGATARDIMLTGVFGIEQGVATQDIDYAVAVSGWEEFDRVKARLIEPGQFTVVEDKPHKVIFAAPGGPAIPVDLIPFGGVERPKNSVAWQSGDQGPMNVVGYDDALAAAPWVSLADDLQVRVISIPWLAVLKIFAWSDRRDSNAGKDARAQRSTGALSSAGGFHPRPQAGTKTPDCSEPPGKPCRGTRILKKGKYS